MKVYFLFLAVVAFVVFCCTTEVHAQCVTLSCPHDTTVRTDSGKCTAVVNYSNPTLSGGCELDECDPPPGSIFSKGFTDVTCLNTLGDIVCGFTVTVADSEAPKVSCSDVGPFSVDGNCRAEVFVHVTATDNCGPAQIHCNPFVDPISSNGFFPLGVTTVKCTATDGANNVSDTCSFTVTVVDKSPPVITCPIDVGHRFPIRADAGKCSTTVRYEDYGLSVRDNCTTSPKDSCEPPSGSTFPVGSTSVKCFATDASGNVSDTCRFEVEVSDLEDPTIACPRDTTVTTCDPTGATVGFRLPTATDNCPGTIYISCTPDSGSFFPVGKSRVECTAHDAHENTGMCAFAVHVNLSTKPPVITDSSVTPALLWPPNHKMRDVTVNYKVTTGCPTQCHLEVTSNEPVNGTGDGDVEPDWNVVDQNHLQLRAERAGTGNGRIYTVSIICTDQANNADTANLSVVVAHNITDPLSGAAFKVGSTVNFAGTFWDIPGNKHTATWTFDNLSVKGSVIEPSGLKNGKVTGSYKFTAAGVYKVQMNITDQKGFTTNTNTQGDLEAIVVIYDPNGGYTVGGGWFASPTGSFANNLSLTGKVSFGFAMSYFKNATYPKGETQFQFNDGGLEFNATNFNYLAISGPKAQFKGSGKVIGDAASYNFILTVIDGQATGGGGTDKVRTKIYNKNTGTVIYDNQPGASDAADPSVAVGPGSSITLYNGGGATGSTAVGAHPEGIEESASPAAALIPDRFGLEQSYPNPFNPVTVIHYQLPVTSDVLLKVYNTLGQEVATLVDRVQSAGYRSAEFNGSNLASGTYLYKLTATPASGGEPFVKVMKTVLMK